jgi:uncharacterized HhH-GPD family protein
MATTKVTLYLSGDKEADRLLADDPLALLIGLVLDQQIPLEWAFYGPLNLRNRLGRLDARSIAEMPEDALVAAFAARPALHRFPASMARRVQVLARHIADEYGGDPAAIWTTAKDGKQLLARVRALPGFGDHKARIFVAFLGKQFGVRPEGWVEAASPFGDPGTHLSIADIDSPDSLALVREHKRALKAAAKRAAPAKRATTVAKAKKPAPAKRATAKRATTVAKAKKAAPAKRATAKRAAAKTASPAAKGRSGAAKGRSTAAKGRSTAAKAPARTAKEKAASPA